MHCNNCPRNCHSNYYCKKSNSDFKINLYQTHFGEEPPVSGLNGSGTVFFSNCNLKCCFCQNYEISQLGNGKIYSEDELFNIFIELLSSGVHNINLVTPTPYTDRIIPVLKKFKLSFNDIPIIWNSNAYENPKTLEKLQGLVDVYLPDFKYGNNKLAEKFSDASNYVRTAIDSISEMLKQQPENIIDSNGIILKGVIIRHLALPSCIDNSKKVLDIILKEFGIDTYISLMSQYYPVYNASVFPELNRIISEDEYDQLLEYSEKIGFLNGYIQGLRSATDTYTPHFNK